MNTTYSFYELLLFHY